MATGPGLDRPLLPEQHYGGSGGGGPDSGGSGSGGYTMNRTRLFYQDQYGTGDGSGPDTAVSSGPGSAGTTSTVLHFPDRPGITGTAGGP